MPTHTAYGQWDVSDLQFGRGHSWYFISPEFLKPFSDRISWKWAALSGTGTGKWHSGEGWHPGRAAGSRKGRKFYCGRPMLLFTAHWHTLSNLVFPGCCLLRVPLLFFIEIFVVCWFCVFHVLQVINPLTHSLTVGSPGTLRENIPEQPTQTFMFWSHPGPLEHLSVHVWKQLYFVLRN